GFTRCGRKAEPSIGSVATSGALKRFAARRLALRALDCLRLGLAMCLNRWESFSPLFHLQKRSFVTPACSRRQAQVSVLPKSAGASKLARCPKPGRLSTQKKG